MNLLELERIIIYIFAVCLLKEDGRSDLFTKREDIVQEVNGWFKESGRRPRTVQEMDESFKNLEMTGMLQVGVDDDYRMSFSSYADILRRLEEADPEKIFTLIQALKD